MLDIDNNIASYTDFLVGLKKYIFKIYVKIHAAVSIYHNKFTNWLLEHVTLSKRSFTH